MSNGKPGDPSYAELEAENTRLRREVAGLRGEVAELRERVRRLTVALEEARRAGKRQAAPFSKGEPKADPKTPGRKPGNNYETHHRRAVPETVDRTVPVPLPESCCDPACNGRPIGIEVLPQYQIDLPPIQPIVTQFDVHIGVCDRCGKRIRGRHIEQTSDALHSASVQIGPNAIGLAAYLNKSAGMSWGRVAELYRSRFGLDVERSTLCRATVERLAEKLQPTFEHLVEHLWDGLVVYADETGWKVAGLRKWLWVFVKERFTVYVIRGSRGADVLEEMLGFDFAGVIIRDGAKAYRKLAEALHQTCLQHLLRRSVESLEVALGDARTFPAAVKQLLKDAIDLGKRREELSERGLAVAIGRLQARCDRLLELAQADAENERFRQHLLNERDNLFTFLEHPHLKIAPTNNTSEGALRGMGVINRKLSGGNRSDAGAKAQGIITSIIRTCQQQGMDAVNLFVQALRSAGEVLFPLAVGPPLSAAP